MFQVIGAIALPIIMLIVVGSPFEEPIIDEPKEMSPETLENIYFVFFTLWVIWILILIRIVYQANKGTLSIRNKF